jgi:O-antigen/teichoic acid export membrane protein
MSVLAKLVSQTAIYGLSSIFGRFLNYLLVPLYTYYFSAADYGVISEFYAYAGFFAVLLIFGLETGYFRFRDKTRDGVEPAFPSAFILVAAINSVFLSLVLFYRQALADLLHYSKHAEYLLYFAIILSLDAVAAIPFARLRAEEKAFRFAGIKLAEIVLTVLLNLFFVLWCPKLYATGFGQRFLFWYHPALAVGYIFLANVIASAFKCCLLMPQLRALSGGFNAALCKRMLVYSGPLVIIGFAGIINEMLDRALLKYLLPYDLKTNLQMLGIYSACYKLSILMSLFIQAFRYAAEPFFFAYADKADARQVYADILKYFVIFCVFIFLSVILFIDFFKYFIGPEFRAGLDVVPILLLANLCLGIYINLSIWYKLTDRTLIGAWVSLFGAVLTIALNLDWIPRFSYYGSAWATLICYAFMAWISYALGQYYYPVPYPVKRILVYIAIGYALYYLNLQLMKLHLYPIGLLGAAMLVVYLLIAVLLEKPYQRRRSLS